jgi:hypothetical protein
LVRIRGKPVPAPVATKKVLVPAVLRAALNVGGDTHPAYRVDLATSYRGARSLVMVARARVSALMVVI